MTQVTTKDDVTILIDLPEKKENRHVQPSFVKACYGDERVANVLDYFVYAASREAKDRGLKGCNVVTVTRTHEKILEKLQSKPSRKSLIRYLKKLSEWGYVLSEPYKRDFEVHLDLIQEKVTTPPEIKPRERGCKPLGKGGHVTTLQPSENEGEKVDMLQLKVDTLQQKVDMLQLKVDTLVTLQPALEMLQRLIEGHFSEDPLYITSILPLLTCNSNVVSSGDENDHPHNLPFFKSENGSHLSTESVDNQAENVDNPLEEKPPVDQGTVPETTKEVKGAKEDEAEEHPIAVKTTKKVKPELPSGDAVWNADTVLQVFEGRLGRYYPNGAKRKSDRVRDVESASCQSIVDMDDLWTDSTAENRDLLLKIMDHLETRHEKWWFKTNGRVMPHQLVEKDRIHMMYDELNRLGKIKRMKDQRDETAINTAIHVGSNITQPTLTPEKEREMKAALARLKEKERQAQEYPGARVAG